ncbi:unnamed protein product [Timema podura]|uniref:Uncharacterized protein n=1 Tax=Timema podura TaxID=61482 RepID=A0ABN7PDV8_TIMPD|nr:unnamed protein product [Timema podura]
MFQELGSQPLPTISVTEDVDGNMASGHEGGRPRAVKLQKYCLQLASFAPHLNLCFKGNIVTPRSPPLLIKVSSLPHADENLQTALLPKTKAGVDGHLSLAHAPDIECRLSAVCSYSTWGAQSRHLYVGHGNSSSVGVSAATIAGSTSSTGSSSSSDSRSLRRKSGDDVALLQQVSHQVSQQVSHQSTLPASSPSRRPAIFDAFRPRSKSDASRAKKPGTLISQMKNVMQVAIGSKGRAGVTWWSRGRVSDFWVLGVWGSILGPGTDLSDCQNLPSQDVY